MTYRQMRSIVVLMLLLVFSPLSFADITMSAPSDGDVFQTRPCPSAVCTAEVPLNVSYSGPQTQRIQVVFTRQEDGQRHERSLCFFDQIEGISCSSPPNNFDTLIVLAKGTWTAIPQSTVNGVVKFGDSVTFTVEEVTLPPAGPVGLNRVDPIRAAARILLRDNDGSGALYSESETVRLIGTNLDRATNPFLEVYLSPIPFQEPTFSSNSALPTGDWCLYEADIVDSGTLPGGESYIEVALPELPLETPDRCTVPPRPEGSIFTTSWRWVIRDKWIRDERQHATWAINSPRNVPWKDAPVFTVTKPPYPLVDGFGFRNYATDATYKEFLSVYGNNAYVCIDCLPVVGCACALPRIPDPIYHIMWQKIYKEAIDSTNGSCNGMSATSLLMAREELQTEQFDPLVHFPAGFMGGGDPAIYKDSNFCTPYCSPPKPDNLWAHVRTNHGVQISREFLLEILETLGAAILDPSSGQVFNGVPNTTRAKVANNPQGFVTCFFELGNGHCVTPYSVVGSDIRIYDNSAQLKTDRVIEVTGGDYNYPLRSSSPNKGNAFVAFPIDIWRDSRSLFGLRDIQKLFNGEMIKFIMSIVVGDAEMEIQTESGSLGFSENGDRSDLIAGGLLVPMMGPSDQEQRNPFALVTLNRESPIVRIHSKGDSYTYHTGAGGHLLQLQSNSAVAGNQDQIHLQFEDQQLLGLTFEPESRTDNVVPQIGLAIADGERALFRYDGVRVQAGGTVGFGGDKAQHSATFMNDSGLDTPITILLDRTGGDYVRTMFGPIEVPNGAVHTLVLQDWPNVDTATSTIDEDGDGVPEITSTVAGNPLPIPENLGVTADLAIDLSESATSTPTSQVLSVSVRNLGPDDAQDVIVRVSSPRSSMWEAIQNTGGDCNQSADDYQCSFATLPSGGLQSLQLRSLSSDPIKTASATVFGTSRDPDMSNDSQTIATGDDSGSSALVPGATSSDSFDRRILLLLIVLAAIVALIVIYNRRS